MHEEMSYTASIAMIHALTAMRLKTYSVQRTINADRTHWISAFTVAIAGGDGCAGVCSDGTRHVVVGKVLPQQQSLLGFLPRQTVTVIVNFECLAPGNKGVI